MWVNSFDWNQPRELLNHAAISLRISRVGKRGVEKRLQQMVPWSPLRPSTRRLTLFWMRCESTVLLTLKCRTNLALCGLVVDKWPMTAPWMPMYEYRYGIKVWRSFTVKRAQFFLCRFVAFCPCRNEKCQMTNENEKNKKCKNARWQIWFFPGYNQTYHVLPLQTRMVVLNWWFFYNSCQIVFLALIWCFFLFFFIFFSTPSRDCLFGFANESSPVSMYLYCRHYRIFAHCEVTLVIHQNHIFSQLHSQFRLRLFAEDPHSRVLLIPNKTNS